MIDLHFHCLPGIDDGPRDWDEAVELCRLAASEGTTHIVATPHVLRDRWMNEDPAARDVLLRGLNERLGGNPVVLRGCEFYYSADALELWEARGNGPLRGLNDSRYLLMEFPALTVPRDAERVLYEFRFSGAVPLIAHPERNLAFATDPELLEALVAVGARTQVTAASLLGEFGPNALAACQLFFERGLVHSVSSDAHHVTRRPPRLAAAYEVARQSWGDAVAERIFVTNARAIVEDEELAL